MSFLHKFSRAVASSKWGAKIISMVLPHIDRLLFRLSRGKIHFSAKMIGLPIAMVTTTGARSGLARTVPLVYVREHEEDKHFALVATNFGNASYPAWYYNLKAHPQAIVHMDGEDIAYIAEEIEGELYQRYWRCTQALYQGYSRYEERLTRNIPIFLLTPQQ